MAKRYFFHVSAGIRPMNDDQGIVLSGPKAALLHAATIATELPQDGERYVVCVIDEEGSVIGQITVHSNSLVRDGLLTEREKGVLALVVRGASSKEVAQSLNISRRTVDFHRANIMQKLGARNIAELVRIVLQLVVLFLHWDLGYEIIQILTT